MMIEINKESITEENHDMVTIFEKKKTGTTQKNHWNKRAVMLITKLVEEMNHS